MHLLQSKNPSASVGGALALQLHKRHSQLGLAPLVRLRPDGLVAEESGRRGAAHERRQVGIAPRRLLETVPYGSPRPLPRAEALDTGQLAVLLRHEREVLLAACLEGAQALLAP